MPKNPNRVPFPRQRLIKRIGPTGEIHPVVREALEAPFERIDPDGYHHTVGAADACLDAMGVLYVEQFGSFEEEFKYRLLLHRCVDAYSNAVLDVVPARPYLRGYVHATGRKAHSGEPRPLLRIAGDRIVDVARELSEAGAPDAMRSMPLDMRSMPLEWEPEGLYGVPPRNFLFPDSRPPRLDNGVIIPPDASPVVERFGLLPPSEATPELPPRVGHAAYDKRLHTAAVRDQGRLGTCLANAVATALSIAAARQGMHAPQLFSAAWLHLVSGTDVRGGRSLEAVLAPLYRNELPCPEDLFPYPTMEKEAAGSWQTPARVAAARALSAQLGTLEIAPVPVDRIAEIKTRLAMGWVVVAATHLSDVEWHGLHFAGTPVVPLPGTQRKGAHAWTIVGYDHVDGNLQWKYQGRFLALTPWGHSFPQRRPYGPGVALLPFSTLITQGIGAYALRFSGA